MTIRHVVAAFAALAAVAGCSTTGSPAESGERYYVSIGDSYAAGYQPTSATSGTTSTEGFAYQVAEKTRVHGVPMRLANFGCSGVTSGQVLDEPGCDPAALGPDPADYGGLPQARAATRFVAEHRGRVGLITVVVGGNDIRPCLPIGAPLRDDALDCVDDAVSRLRGNLAELLTELRAAAGPDVPIIGLTYPDMLLGAWLRDGQRGKDIAAASVGVFRDRLNTALREEYSEVGAEFVDITAATGAYTPLDATTTDPAHGVVPQAVAKACEFTHFCSVGDVHPTVHGHTLIAERVVRAAHIA
ncbi:GDSL-type esterase/lipase family protein [Actinokineospora pegani]|uniref:GDSL-type esterase/lipase family protein n=1 Tax=Actinokineospora pegani TaxID=2654637 RepID=UPI0018D4969A|nr:GDSL-type esterase/lipase family protein [Actinokineospora pegani]